MPEITRFLGIVISMYFDEHNPPHFHVRYNEYRASMAIRDFNIIAGSLPARVRGLVEEWAELHQDELFLKPANKNGYSLQNCCMTGISSETVSLEMPLRHKQENDPAWVYFLLVPYHTTIRGRFARLYSLV